ncbi:hypothetical protein [Halobacillus halophilus]|nr:hypothetical protein [Halobacillus halophilus]MCA1012118.1 hypothetical protein [Halobacillus halophilus]
MAGVRQKKHVLSATERWRIGVELLIFWMIIARTWIKNGQIWSTGMKILQ